MAARVVVMVGTRPEAIKMAPVCRALRASGVLEPVLVSSGQHRELLRSAFTAMELTPDVDLEVMTEQQSLNGTLARVLTSLSEVLRELQPAALLTQGDTGTALAASLCAYNLRVPVGHVEAGLRTYDHGNPFPEEGNRQLIDRLCMWCFAPTPVARDNLLAERVEPSRVFVTGNTAVDALLWMLPRCPPPPLAGSFVLLTLHRRESFGEPLRAVLEGVRDFLDAIPGAQVLWPVHPNPAVTQAADAVLGGAARLHRVAPVPYDQFCGMLSRCRLVLTDSGGVQEEAPSLGKVVLIARETTERPEALAGGRNRLVGRCRADVARALAQAWDEPPYAGPVPAPNPYGDGTAAAQLAGILARHLGLAGA